MKIFVDTANLTEIEEALKRGFVQGITTNPSLLAKEPKSEFHQHIGKIIELIQRYASGIHLSVEVFSQDPSEILQQAKSFIRDFGYPELSVKVQIGWNELAVIKRLSSEGISVNCTACMSVNQGVMAAAAGAKFISFFWGRIRDAQKIEEKLQQVHTVGSDERQVLENFSKLKREMLDRKALEEDDFDPFYVVRKSREIFDHAYPQVQIISGSMRSASDVKNAALAGSHIITVPPKFFPDMISHFKTDEVVQQFLSDFSKWMS